MPAFLKCTCEHCGGRIEYPAEAVGANVACPHCQKETPLKLDGGDDADVVVVGGSKAKLVIGAVVACIVAVVALAAAGIYVKKQGGAKEQVAGKPAVAVAPPTAPAAPANMMAKVELDPPKAVVPVVAKFQNGLTGTQRPLSR